MSVRRGRILSGIVIAVFLALGAGGWYGYQELPRIPGVPKAPVVGVPQGALSHQPLPAYDGPHPRVMPRPPEYFPFPITIGEIGPVETLFAGPSTYPFYCDENSVTNRQPLIDNHEGEGVPVFAEGENGELTDEVIGYSRDCSHATAVTYYYRSTTDGDFYLLEDANGDIDQVTVNGRTTDFIVRLETGTINRYHYAIAALKGDGETASRPSPSNWNKRLIYQMRGGVGVGRRQGDISKGDIISRRADQLARGYAIVYSTANQTSNHYNIWLAEDTARRLKKQFEALYGEPLYTVGLGGSGGAIQQYLFAQNAPGLLDAAIPLYSYPDMVTQTIYVFDCEPLEYFFDVLDADNPRWKDARERTVIQGLSASNEVESRFSTLKTAAALFDGRYRDGGQGATECTQGWRGLVPLVNNPNFAHFMKYFDDEVAERTHWTHWEDLRQFYGAGESGYANSAWDNEGVQYGLAALVAGEISVDTFLRLNASIGGWKEPINQSGEKLWFLNGDLFPPELSVWSEQNMNIGSLDRPASRSRASLEAIEGIYRSGHVFLGDAEIPIIDLRHYLDGELDMHHSFASFSARERMRRARGHADNQLIWVAHKDYTPLDEALDTMDRWMLNIMDHPEAGVAANRPVDASDQCFDREGNIIAAGPHVWDGAWNGQASGACMQEYPTYRTSRQVAGAPITDDVFKCELQPVEQALAEGVYGEYSQALSERMMDMQRIFPTGVCDYNAPDLARPSEDLIPAREPVRIAGHLIRPDYRQPVDGMTEGEVAESAADEQPVPVSLPMEQGARD
ncbi:hypothetical protein AUP74_02353 [Microbulbifer aggregans]|uniref:DUF6351 domain-containing protein n=1 Tax=Microbulbifer aggregans TaxID=1769779 RepID=A0A1C9W9B7_9GAMM|nr:DUF6351 family protein [Microbulbifer aggregans]AOS97758.1 hypothetical protein AUP74_02353 [Microbulbifer aggregans]